MKLCRLWALGFGLWMLGFGPWADVVRAQVNMPDPSQIHGKAIPAPELPDGTVTVRVVRETIGNNVAGQLVTVTTGNASREDSTDAQGRAEFPNLQGGVQGRAEVTVDGEKLVSEPFVVPATGGLRVILVAGLQQAAARRQQQQAEELAAPPVKGTVVLGGSSRILMEFRDDRLQMFYMLDIVNNARNRVDIGGPLIIQLPRGASAAGVMEGSSPSATISGDVLTVQGPFAPGTTSVQVGFFLEFSTPDVVVTQTWPVPIEQTTVAIEQVGGVTMASPQFRDVRTVQAEDGTPYLLAGGAGLPANGTLTLNLGNMPVHSRTPMYVTLGLAGVLLLAGAWLAFGRRGTTDTRQQLAARRDTLLADLAQLEAQHLRGQLDARGAARRERLLIEHERIYGELDAEHPAA